MQHILPNKFTRTTPITERESKNIHFFYTGATAFSNAFYGRSSGFIYLDNVGCTGTESRLVDCSHDGIGVHNCRHSEDTGIQCQVSGMQSKTM